MFGSLYDQKCVCAECARAQGKRGLEKYEKIEKVDYSNLLKWKFWVYGADLEQAADLSMVKPTFEKKTETIKSK